MKNKRHLSRDICINYTLEHFIKLNDDIFSDKSNEMEDIYCVRKNEVMTENTRSKEIEEILDIFSQNTFTIEAKKVMIFIS